MPGEQVLRLEVVTGIPPQFVGPWARVGPASGNPVAEAVRERRLVWVPHHAELARSFPRVAVTMPFASALAVAPIITGTTVWGAWFLLWPDSHPPRLSSQERERISAACRRAGHLIERAARAGRPVVPGRQPRALIQPPARDREPAEVRGAVEFAERLPEGCCALDAEGRIVFISAVAADLVGESVQHLLGTQLWRALPWLVDPAFEDRYRAAAVSRRPKSFTALRPPDQWLSFECYPDASGISMRITPAETALSAHDQGSPHTTPTAATALVGAPYHLMHLAAVLTEAVSMRDVADLVADEVMPAFDAQALAVFVAEENRLHIIGYHGYGADFMDRFGATPLTADTPGARALATGIPSFFATREELEQADPSLIGKVTKAAFAFVPLIASGRPVGCCMIAYDTPHPFPPDERAALTSIAGLIAQALERARLYDAKHQIASGLQAALLPHVLPRIHGLEVAARYLPATRGLDIGGDFYDLIRLDDNTAAAVIGDVQGHDVTAAALMGQVRTAVHAHAAVGASPSEVLSLTNRLLTDLDPGLFTSCLYAQLDLAHHRAWLATAGHPPALVRRPDGRAEVLHVPPGLLLGIDPEADYPATEIPLPAGTVLALYTDGLIESPGIDLEDAAADVAGQIARAPHHSLETLADIMVHRARYTDPRTDDIALLLLNPQPTGE